jgi:hypothetical protein
MTRAIGAMLALAVWLVAACAPALSIAVENHDSVGYVLRVLDGRDRAWRVPANGAGVGPVDEGGGTRLVLLVTEACEEVGRYGLTGGDVTMVVEAGAMANPDLVTSVDRSLAPLVQIPDPCA